MVQPETPLSHVPEHGICVRCGLHLADGRELLPCRSEAPTIPAPPKLGAESVIEPDDEP